MSVILITLLLSSVTMSLLALLYMAFTPSLSKRYSTKWIYYAWLIIIIGLIIPFRPSLERAVIQIDVPSVVIPFVPVDSSSVYIPGTNETISSPDKSALPASTPDNPMSASAGLSRPAVIFAIWLTGVVVVLACHVIRHKRYIRSVWRWGEEVTDNRTLEIWHNIRKEMGVSAQIGLQKSEMTGSPLLTGILYPRIMLPKTNIPDDEMVLILKHELIHYIRKDLWYKGLVLLAVALHWFNPVVYIIAKNISLQCERSCDDEIVRYKDTDSRLQYSTAIIHSVRYTQSSTALSTNFFGGKKEMKNRISLIMDTRTKKRGTIIICTALILTLVTGLAFAVSSAAAPEETMNNPYTNDGEPAAGEADTGPDSEPDEATADRSEEVGLADSNEPIVKIPAVYFSPEDIKDLIHVVFEISTNEISWSAVLTDTASLLWLEKNLGTAEASEYDSACPFWGTLFLTRSDGENGMIHIAVDNCKAFLSDSTQYTWGKGDNEAFFALFGATDFDTLVRTEYGNGIRITYNDEVLVDGTIPLNQPFELRAQIDPSVIDTELRWWSSNPNIFSTVPTDDGKGVIITGLSRGHAELMLKMGDKVTSCIIRVIK